MLTLKQTCAHKLLEGTLLKNLIKVESLVYYITLNKEYHAFQGGAGMRWGVSKDFSTVFKTLYRDLCSTGNKTALQG